MYSKKMLVFFSILLLIFSGQEFILAQSQDSLTELSLTISRMNNLSRDEKSELQENVLEMVYEDNVDIDEINQILKSGDLNNFNTESDIELELKVRTRQINSETANNLKNKYSSEEINEIFEEGSENGLSSEEINSYLYNNPDASLEEIEDYFDDMDKDDDDDDDDDNDDDDDDDD